MLPLRSTGRRSDIRCEPSRFGHAANPVGTRRAGSGTYCAQAGESLWQYANRWGLSIEKLVEANPHIRDICALEEGEKVMLP